MDEIRVGQIWTNKNHGRPSTIIEIDHDGKSLSVTYIAQQPEYQEAPDKRTLDENLFRGLYVISH